MGEIKSTLDIAMERLKKIEITEKERDEIKRKEISQKASGLATRYIEGSISLYDVQKEIDKMDVNTKEMIKEILLSRLIEELSLQNNYERLIMGIEWIKGKELNEVKDELEYMAKQFEREKANLRKNLEDKILDSLRKSGIEGSAILVNIDSSDLWKKEEKELNRTYEAKIKIIKDRLKGL